jgi:hypothetical protein
MTAMNKRISYHLTELKNELRKRALKEKDEKKRRDYWRLYYKAVDAAHEVDSMVADAEIRTLVEYLLRYGRLPDDWKEQVAKLQEDKANAEEEKEQPPVEDSLDDDDIPPRQLGLWNEEE